MGHRAKIKRQRTEARRVLDDDMTGLPVNLGNGHTLPYDPALMNHAAREWARRQYLALMSQAALKATDGD